jgi:predicted glycosyltransferase
MDSKNLKLIYTYIEGTRVHLNIQQDDCNQLNYKIQQNQYKYSIYIACIALGVTIIFSILSILCSYFDWKYIKSDLPVQIEYLSDSIKVLNGKIEQQNEIIQKYFILQKNDSIASPPITNKLK